MVRRLSHTLTSALALLLLGTAAATATAAPDKPNVLLLISDDLRPEIEPYDCAHTSTPHLQALADEATTFMHAYVQQALCAPTRNSFLTGQ